MCLFGFGQGAWLPEDFGRGFVMLFGCFVYCLTSRCSLLGLYMIVAVESMEFADRAAWHCAGSNSS